MNAMQIPQECIDAADGGGRALARRMGRFHDADDFAGEAVAELVRSWPRCVELYGEVGPSLASTVGKRGAIRALRKDAGRKGEKPHAGAASIDALREDVGYEPAAADDRLIHDVESSDPTIIIGFIIEAAERANGPLALGGRRFQRAAIGWWSEGRAAEWIAEMLRVSATTVYLFLATTVDEARKDSRIQEMAAAR